MPDQSQQFEKTTPPSQQTEESLDPSNTVGNSPADATPEALESNVTRASEGEKVQADQTINKDPHVETSSVADDMTANPARATPESSDNYDDEDAWPYRALQQEAKHRDLDAGGKRDELVARLREADSAGSDTQDAAVPTAEVDPSNVENGGIQRTDLGAVHASVLQGLSQERRQQQLASVRERSSRSKAESSDEG